MKRRAPEEFIERAFHAAGIKLIGPRQSTGAEALLGAMKGISWESPRGPISIDPETQGPGRNRETVSATGLGLGPDRAQQEGGEGVGAAVARGSTWDFSNARTGSARRCCLSAPPTGAAMAAIFWPISFSIAATAL